MPKFILLPVAPADGRRGFRGRANPLPGPLRLHAGCILSTFYGGAARHRPPAARGVGVRAALGRSGGGPATKPLEGRVALVSGSTRGLGRVIAARLAAEGASLVVTGRRQDAVDAVVRSLRDGGAEAAGVAADLSRPAEAHRLAAAALEHAGRIDILVNNAGMSLRGNAWDVTDAEWDEQVNVNLRTPFILSQHAARSMINGGRGGRIVNVSTIGAHASLHDAAVYDSAKAGLEGLTRDLALELGRFGITVNAVAAGAIVYRPGQNDTAELAERFAAAIPVGRAGRAEDVAAAVLFFCLPEAEFITGQVLGVDGGHRLYLNDGFGLARGRATGGKLRPELGPLAGGGGAER